MTSTEHVPLKFLICLSLVFGCASAALGGMFASLQAPNPVALQQGAGGPESGRSPPRLADPAICGGGPIASEWLCRGAAAAA